MKLSQVFRSGLNRSLVGGLSTLTLGLVAASTTLATPLTLLQAEQTVEVSGVSGGPSLVTDCAAELPSEPSQEIQLSERFVQQSGFLRFLLEAEGSPVLVLDGPAGRFCSLGDSEAEQQPEIAGYWLPGVYRVYVGDRNGLSQPYRLSILKAEN